MRISILGLGYVGLPLAIALARHDLNVVGFDVDEKRIAQLRNGHDRTGEIDPSVLRTSRLHITAAVTEMAGSDVFIITVPTPVDHDNLPDLTLVRAASNTIGSVIRAGAVVVLESTVYPGVTEDVVGREVAAASGLVCGRDFFLGYSPERINPGDRSHTIETITKVVAGQTPDVTELLAGLYGRINGGRIWKAANIPSAEAAKVIENAQRDINIAFINEVAMICNRKGLSIYDVLDAAGTKWNFLPFTPGLVGGHCIGIDPYYLAYFAKDAQYHPDVILSGRRINDSMGRRVADLIARRIGVSDTQRPARILVLGLTFKEDVPDLRNSKVVDLVRRLREFGHHIDIHDPIACPLEAKQEHNLDIIESLDIAGGYDAIVAAVAHSSYRNAALATFCALLNEGGLVADLKGIWRKQDKPEGVAFWTL